MVKYAFCGCSLEFGSKIIAFFHLTAYSILFLIYALYAWMPSTIHEEERELEEEKRNHSFYSEEENITFHGPAHLEIEGIRATYFLEYTAFIQLVFCGYLVYGVLKKSAEHMFSWVLCQIAFSFHASIIIILNLVFVVQHYPSHAMYFIFQEIASSGFELYCAMVIYSYIQQLSKNQEDGMQFF